MNDFTISAIIPVINEATTIVKSIDEAWLAGANEVIVVDGGSSDETTTMAASRNCKVFTSQAGRGPQLNVGVRESIGDILLFLHADNHLAPNSCDQIRAVMHNKPVRCFGGFRQRILADGWIYRMIERGNYFRAYWQGLVYGDQAMFVSRDLFDQVGGFPNVPIMEDFEISRKLCRLVWPIMLDGPIHVNARRWERTGPLRQTVMNWRFAMAYRLGASPEWIANRYRRHDQK